MAETNQAIVVGSGPNGLAAAVTLARAGWRVTVRERNAVPGGGVRSAELTLPGFVHDTGAAVFPMALVSPFFRTIPLGERGADMVFSPFALAIPSTTGTPPCSPVPSKRRRRDSPTMRSIM
jgi:phytoene dehydrogenase-like protein